MVDKGLLFILFNMFPFPGVILLMHGANLCIKFYLFLYLGEACRRILVKELESCVEASVEGAEKRFLTSCRQR